MKNIFSIALVCAAVFAADIFFTGSRGTARSDEYEKHEQVYRHRQSKDILPFRDILKAVKPFIRGEIIETEFEVEHGLPVYEFKYVDKSGRVREMYVNARTGKIIKDKLD
jgi:uncharacterized membrane protein YkoI